MAPQSFPGPYVFTHTRVDALLWGAVAALIHRQGIDTRHRQTLRWLAPFAIAYLGCMIVFTDARETATYDWWMIGSGASGLIVVLWLVVDGRNPLSRVMATRPLAALGQRSYGGYLWHYPVFFFVTAHLARYSDPIRATLAIVLTILLSDLTFRFVEIPFFKLKDRLVPRKSRERAPRAAPVAGPTIARPSSSPEPEPGGL